MSTSCIRRSGRRVWRSTSRQPIRAGATVRCMRSIPMATAFDSCRARAEAANFGYMKLIIISLLLGSSAVTLAQDSPRPSDKIPAVAFCELVKNPKPYFDKSIRVTANLELATEASYLRDESCVVSRDD